VWADSAETLEKTRRYFLPRRREGHVIPVFVATGHGPFKFVLLSPEGLCRARIWRS
jgi:hypothetical protein